MLNDKIIPLTFDSMFTNVFNSIDMLPILERFISDFLELPLEDVRGNLKLLSRDLTSEVNIERDKQVDLLLNINNEIINIEMNTTSVGHQRNYVYAHKIAGTTLERGDNSYSNILKTLQINFNNYKGGKRFISREYIKNEDNEITDKKFEIVQIYIEKVLDKSYNYQNKWEEQISKWCKLLISDNLTMLEEGSSGIMENEEVKDLSRKVEYLSKEPRMVTLYTALPHEEMIKNTLMNEAREQGMAEGIAEGMAEGMAEGQRQKTIEIVSSMLEKGLDIDLIKDVTGLSISEINSLKEH